MKRIIKYIFCDGWLLNVCIAVMLINATVLAILGDWKTSLLHFNFGVIWYVVKVVGKRADKWQKEATQHQVVISELLRDIEFFMRKCNKWDFHSATGVDFTINDDGDFLIKNKATQK